MPFRIYFLCIITCLSVNSQAHAWGFWAHRIISSKAVDILPAQMLRFYSFYQDYISEHSVDPDKKRYCDMYEGHHHYIDLDHYCQFPCASFPKTWEDAAALYPTDTLYRYGTLPWQISLFYAKLTQAFKDRNPDQILYLSCYLSHYIADSYVPLHTVTNYNGQHSEQLGIHAFWESQIPEMFGLTYNYNVSSATYIENTTKFIWKGILSSENAADSVLRFEIRLRKSFPKDKMFCFDEANDHIYEKYSADFAKAYSEQLNGMIEKRMRLSIFAVGCLWMSAWVDAGQPDLDKLIGKAGLDDVQDE